MEFVPRFTGDGMIESPEESLELDDPLPTLLDTAVSWSGTWSESG